ncbi:MAG: hypothetical protein HY843_05320 [Bdellovibrio sp.]|nr:hypothetical protein [Bdellovibrio sp.]
MGTSLNKVGYGLITGKTEGSEIKYLKNVGIAIQYSGCNNYALKLMMFPYQQYYLVKNDSPSNYTIFAKCSKNKDSIRFSGDVGFGRIRSDLKSHLELRFYLLSSRIYMNLFPSPPVKIESEE